MSILTDNVYEYKQSQANIIVKDRLNANIQFWGEIGTGAFVIYIIKRLIVWFVRKPVGNEAKRFCFGSYKRFGKEGPYSEVS